jgi:dihydroorotate dehydrogenase electron transfer subunit
MVYRQKVKVISNSSVGESCFKLVFASAQMAKAALPGQFVNIKVDDGVTPLLRRPLSIHSVKGKNIVLLYEVVGVATEILSGKKPGECLDIIGPLGSGFSGVANGRYILVAGGMGTAPLVFLAEKLAEVKSRKSKVKNIALIGARTARKVLCATEFRKSGFKVQVSTDDGSLGLKGKATDLLKNILAMNPASDIANIYACGPKPMLKEVCVLSASRSIPAEISLEEHMACGIGACLGCTVETTKGLKRVCKEGPVFKAAEILWK